MPNMTKVFTVQLTRGPRGQERELASLHVTGCGKTLKACREDAQRQTRSIIRSIHYTITPMLER